ncbi:MAG: TolC family protein [Planctomycetes bacterium]|nr:TolC family protein [Planctomycetota bacterium]
MKQSRAIVIFVLAIVGCGILSGCQPADYRKDADKVTADLLKQGQAEALGHNEPFTIETPADTLRRRLISLQNLPIAGPESIGSDQLKPIAHWPEKNYPARAPSEAELAAPFESGKPVKLTLLESLAVGARNSREYQSRKEDVFRTALDLDLNLDEFRNTYTGLIESILSTDHASGAPTTGNLTSGTFRVDKKFESGAILTGRLIVDLAKLLSSDGQSSVGIFSDVSVTIPLMRGAGEYIVREPLTQAQRDLVYAFWNFERFKRQFVVNVASDYLSVLQNEDQVTNAAGNYERLITSARRARRLGDAQRLSSIEVDQAQQDELRARENWIKAQQSYQQALDRFKITLGLPTDANIALDRMELERLAANARKVLGEPDELAKAAANAHAPSLAADAPVVLPEPDTKGAGPYEMAESQAVKFALDNRTDLRVAQGQVYDAQRAVVVAADALKMGVNLVGNASIGQTRGIGSATLPDAQLRPSRGSYSAGLELDLPWERTAERNIYRDSYINLERSVRDVQALEDQIKLDIRSGLRQLLQARESYKIQVVAMQLARRRVDSTKLFLQAGRAAIRDVLEAERDLLDAQNALTASLVDYRVNELQLQRDMGVLQVDSKGQWREFNPNESH